MLRRICLICSLLIIVVAVYPAGAQSNELGRGGQWRDNTFGVGLPPEDSDDEADDEAGDDLLEVACYLPDSVRFADCGNGTVTDQVTGNVWLKNASCMPMLYYAEANAEVATLGDGTHPACGLSDGSSPGDWRLPTRDEWAELIQQAQANGCAWPDFLLPDTEGLGCATEGDPFEAMGDGFPIYWSSTTVAASPGAAWGASVQAFVSPLSPWGKRLAEDPDPEEDPSPPLRIWPVRRGAGR